MYFSSHHKILALFALVLVNPLLVIASTKPKVTPSNYQTSTSVKEICTTKYGKSSLKGPIPTTTRTTTARTFTVTITSTSTPVRTVTPSTTTKTTTTTNTVSTVTTKPATTDTATVGTVSTIIYYEATTITTTVATTTSTVTSTTTNTVTIPASSGFIPATESKGPPSNDNYIRGFSNSKPSIKGRANSKRNVMNLVNGHAVYTPAVYPTTVICSDHVSLTSYGTIGVVASTTSTTTAPTPTSTVTASTVVTSTSTVYPPDVTSFVTTTDTTSTTITSTSTESDTLTTTTTIVASATATFYAACDSYNLFGGTNFGILIYAPYNDDFSSVTTNSAYDCCVQCITSATCSGSNYRKNNCNLFSASDGQCTQNQAQAEYFEDSGNPVGSFFIVSNGYCGYAVDGS